MQKECCQNMNEGGRKMKKEILVLVGGSGSGKTTIAHELEKEGYERLVTTTTRPMRQGEVNEIDYHFVSIDAFHSLEKVEWTEYAGNFYGLTVSEVQSKLNQHNRLVIVMDRVGAKALKDLYGSVVRVVFLAVSAEELVERLKNRGESDEVIKTRLRHTAEEGEFIIPDVADQVIAHASIDEAVKRILR